MAFGALVSAAMLLLSDARGCDVRIVVVSRGGLPLGCGFLRCRNNWMFTVDAYDPETHNISFGRGGFQGTRPGGAQEFYISHVKVRTPP